MSLICCSEKKSWPCLLKKVGLVISPNVSSLITQCIHCWLFKFCRSCEQLCCWTAIIYRALPLSSLQMPQGASMFLLIWASVVSLNVLWSGAEWMWTCWVRWGISSTLSCSFLEMDSHGRGNLEYTAEALCLEVRPLHKATLGVRLAHRKALSLDCNLFYPERRIIVEHMLRSRHQSSPRRRTSPPAQTPNDRTNTLSRRTRLEPLESNIIRGSQISPEDRPFNRRAHVMFLSSSEEEHEVGEQTGGATAQLSVASSLLTPTPTWEGRLSKRERRRLKSLKRRQKRRERSRQSQLHENEQVTH